MCVQVTAEEVKDNRAIVLELEAKKLDKKVILLIPTFHHCISCRLFRTDDFTLALTGSDAA